MRKAWVIYTSLLPLSSRDALGRADFSGLLELCRSLVGRLDEATLGLMAMIHTGLLEEAVEEGGAVNG